MPRLYHKHFLILLGISIIYLFSWKFLFLSLPSQNQILSSAKNSLQMQIESGNITEFRLVTALSADNFEEALRSCSIIGNLEETQKWMPGYMIAYILKNNVSKKQLDQYRNECPFVTLRKFNASKYPDIDSQNLYKYYLKPLITYEVKKEVDKVFWIDSGVVFKNDAGESITIQSFRENCPAFNQSESEIYKELTTPNIPLISSKERLKLTWKDIGLVTFASRNHMPEALANCQSIRNHPQLKALPMTIFFSDDINDTLTLEYKEKCPHAKIVLFPYERFPDSVKKMEHFRFKALHFAMAFKDHKILLSFDSSILFNKELNLTEVLESSITKNYIDVTLLSSANHNMFSTVHPKMYDCFPNINPNDMLKVTQSQSGVILWIGSEMGWNTMKQFVECSLHPTCMTPPDATKDCNFQMIYQKPNAFSGCHRFDQAAINFILYEISNHEPKLYQQHSPWIKVKRIP